MDTPVIHRAARLDRAFVRWRARRARDKAADTFAAAETALHRAEDAEQAAAGQVRDLTAQLEHLETALDKAKQDALRRFETTGPAHLVVGPPGVGKTRLATEVVRRRLAAEGNARMLLTSQGHDALDNLQAAVQEAAAGVASAPPIIVRAPSEARPRHAENLRQQVAGMLGAMADSPGLARLPPSFRARAEEVAAAAPRALRDRRR